MFYGISLPNFGAYSDPYVLLGLARDAERSGWNGVFLWDHMVWPRKTSDFNTPENVVDSWLVLAAMATQTTNIRIGPVITPLPRRRPWKVAREISTLDHLTGGRAVLGVGLGAFPQDEYEAFGEDGSAAVRADQLDEGLQVLTGLWSHHPFSFSGRHYKISERQFRPVPLQIPRVPIWVACSWPDNKRSLRRAARWDGAVPITKRKGAITPEEVSAMASYWAGQRGNIESFEIVISGLLDIPPSSPEMSAYRKAGATWWLGLVNPQQLDPDAAARHIRLGPPAD